MPFHILVKPGGVRIEHSYGPFATLAEAAAFLPPLEAEHPPQTGKAVYAIHHTQPPDPLPVI